MAEPLDFSPRQRGREPLILLVMVLLIAAAGLVYELSIAAVASYLLGDSVQQFSLIIGVYLSALGLGAYLSKFIEEDLAGAFVNVELSAAILGGLSAPGLFLAFSFTGSFQLVLYCTVILVGTLVGLELPLLIRILERHVVFKDLIAQSLTFDYAGALLGSLGFSLFLIPQLGLTRASIVCGALNALIGLLSTWVLPRLTKAPAKTFWAARVRSAVVLCGLLGAIPFANDVLAYSEQMIYPGRVLYREQSTYQRIVLAEGARENQFELFLNGNLQFSSQDEVRYHEALVHPAFLETPSPRRVLIGGGGDGLAAREVLRWSSVEKVVLVDLDPQMTALSDSYPPLNELNRASLKDPRVRIVNQDAMQFLRETQEDPFDIALLDFPDPSNYAVGKLYSTSFYRFLRKHLAETGTAVVQASSPLLARKTFWCTVATLDAAGFQTRPYHTLVPSFGEWGFVLAKRSPFSAPLDNMLVSPSPGDRAVPPFETLNPESLRDMFTFPADMARLPTDTNTLGTQRLVQYYLSEWSQVN